MCQLLLTISYTCICTISKTKKYEFTHTNMIAYNFVYMSSYILYDKIYESAYTNMYVRFVYTNSYILVNLKLRIHTHVIVFFAPVTIWIIRICIFW